MQPLLEPILQNGGQFLNHGFGPVGGRGQLVHLEGRQVVLLGGVPVAQTDHAVGVAGGDEDLLGLVDLPEGEQLVALADQLNLELRGDLGGGRPGDLEEAFGGHRPEHPVRLTFVHVDPFSS